MSPIITKRYNPNRYQIVIKYWRVAIDLVHLGCIRSSTAVVRVQQFVVKALVLVLVLVFTSTNSANALNLTITNSAKAGAQTTELKVYTQTQRINSAPTKGNGSDKGFKDSSAYKLYALQRVVDTKQSKCFQSIINKENRSWNPRARNGSHYGLGQMRSTWYGTLNAYAQINETIRYIRVRYTTPCHAWRFHKERNYY